MSRLSTFMFVSVVAAVGCTPGPISEMADFGRFNGEVVASWNNDGREMTLREDFIYVDSTNRQWVAPAGSIVNGASIPAAFWSLIGGPFEGKYRNASVVHDVGCESMQQSWEEVHRMFYEACRCAGVSETEAKTLYFAVYYFGPRWQSVVENVLQERRDQNGQVVTEEVPVARLVRVDPLPPTTDEIEQVQAYIADVNPEPNAIRELGRDGLRHRTQGNRGQRDSQRRVEQVIIPSRVVPPVEEQWVAAQVRQYIEAQSPESRSAEYFVQRARGGAYHVSVQFLQPDEQGQLRPYEGGVTAFRVSNQGQILEVTSGR